MKKLIILAMCAVSASGYSKVPSAKKELLGDIKAETKKCAVQIVGSRGADGSENVVGFKSVCSSLVIVSNQEARILIDNEWFVAKITESAESDGGDLDDLAIIDQKGKVIATKTNIPAYDNVIVAMAGDSDFGRKEEFAE